MYMTSRITQGPLVICDVIVDHRPQMGGCSHVDAMRAAEEEFEPTETSRDEADEARPETVIKGIGARFMGPIRGHPGGMG